MALRSFRINREVLADFKWNEEECNLPAYASIENRQKRVVLNMRKTFSRVIAVL